MRRQRTPGGGWGLALARVASTVVIAAFVLAADPSAAAAIDPRLAFLEPLLGKTWRGKLQSPDGQHESLVTRTFELRGEGRVIEVSMVDRDLGSHGEGFIYWDDVKRAVAFFFIEDSGVFQVGTVSGAENSIIFEGTMSWPTPPPDPRVRQSYEFRNTFELRLATAVRDSWFQNAFGPWRPGHVIDFEADLPGNDFRSIAPIEVRFAPAPAAETAEERTAKSVVRVRDISERYATGGLYLIDQIGDRQALFEKENRELLDRPWLTQTWRFCSIFAAKGARSVVIGRNWDNQNVGSVIVSRYRPAGGYASISLSRAIDMGLPLNVRIDEIAASPFGRKLLLAPFYAYDGVNDQGLFAAVTGVGQVVVAPREGKESVFIGYLVRKILDRCRTVDEAARLVEGFVPFDLNESSLNAHFLVADASGRTVILEYAEGAWHEILPDKPWQVLTNKVVYGVPDEDLRDQCWRFAATSEAVERSSGKLDWASGMQILKEVAQSGTTWSVVYLPGVAEIDLVVYQDWDRVYRLRFPEPAAGP